MHFSPSALDVTLLLVQLRFGENTGMYLSFERKLFSFGGRISDQLRQYESRKQFMQHIHQRHNNCVNPKPVYKILKLHGTAAKQRGEVCVFYPDFIAYMSIKNSQLELTTFIINLNKTLRVYSILNEL